MKLIDLFAGAGGMTLGFHRAGFRSVVAVEADEFATLTYAKNFKESIVLNIDAKDYHPISLADVVIGGSPCQGFSSLGKMSPSRRHCSMNKLWEQFMRVVGDVGPRAFVIENVPQIMKGSEFENLIQKARGLGYFVDSKVLNAYEYGAPQRRKRAFIIGMRDREPTFPEPTKKRMTVRDAIGDLPLVPDEENTRWHIGRSPTEKSLERYKCIPPGGNRFDLMRSRPDITPRCWMEKKSGSTDVFGRMKWDEPSLTIRAEFFKPEKGCYLHPEAHRPITHREAARLQTFPDSFSFIGSKIQVARQIGNAVPPVLAYAIGKHLAEVLR